VSIELRHLTSFLTVADAGGISPAAERLGHAQSAVSQRVRQLERTLGVTLLVRSPAGTELTPAGRALAQHAGAAVAAVEASFESARRRAARPTGTIMLGAFSYMVEPVGKLLGELHRTDPGIEVTVREVDFVTQLADLRNGLVDAALLTFEAAGPGFELQALSAHPLAVVLTAGHRLARRSSLRFDDIADEPWPTPPPGAPPAWVDQMFMTARRGRRPPLTPETVRNPDELWPLVLAGRSICVVPDYLMPLVRAVDGLTAISLEDVDPLVLTLTRCTERPAPPAVSRLFTAAARIAPRP
jgi:DNA-binding transcriptional LysR family regulator